MKVVNLPGSLLRSALRMVSCQADCVADRSESSGKPFAAAQTVGEACEGGQDAGAARSKTDRARTGTLEYARTRRIDRRNHAEVLGVVGDREKIQRPVREAQVEPHGVLDRAAFRIGVGVVRTCARTLKI